MEYRNLLASITAVVLVSAGLVSCTSAPVAPPETTAPTPVPAPTPTEMLVFTMPEKGWKPVSSTDEATLKIVLYVPAGKTVSDSKQLFSYQWLKNDERAPAFMAAQHEGTLSGRCRGKTSSFTILAQDERSVTYEWNMKGCVGQTNLHELVRWVAGNQGLHRLSYTRKPAIQPAERKKWLKMLTDAYVESNGSRVD